MKSEKGLMELISYAETLSKIHASGHRVDSEMKEAVRHLREAVGVSDQESHIQGVAKIRALSMTEMAIDSLLADGIISEKARNKAYEGLRKRVERIEVK